MFASRAVTEQIVPVGGGEHAIHFAGRGARCVHPTDNGTHACACDEVDRDAVFLEHLEHTDMRGATRRSTTQNQGDAWATHRCGVFRSGSLGVAEGHEKEEADGFHGEEGNRCERGSHKAAGAARSAGWKTGFIFRLSATS